MSAPDPAAHPRGFASDNHSGAHPDVIAAIVAANTGHASAYGADPWTAAAHNRLREHFGEQADPHLVFTGTGANVLAMRAFARPGDAVICPATAHMNVDECGAPEALAAVKLLPIPTRDGKLTPELAATAIKRIGDEHAAQPRALSISQATELGTVYRPGEVRALAELAHSRDLLLHIDGARLANAAAFLETPLRETTTDAGADILSFGGTKNGLLGAEAVIFLTPGIGERFAFIRKQGTQLASKMRFLAAQLDALLKDDLWLRNARHANSMAQQLGARLEQIDGVELTQPVESNAVFAALAPAAIDRLRAALPGDLPFHVWNQDLGEIRLMCSWDTTPDDIDALATAAAKAAAT